MPPDSPPHLTRSAPRAAPRFTEAGAALYQLLRELERMPVATEALGGESAARLGILRALHRKSGQTASDLARGRGSTRQATQRLVDSLVEEGLAERIANPRHKRAPWLRLTRRGEARYRHLASREAQAVNGRAGGLSPGELRAATRVLRELRKA